MDETINLEIADSIMERPKLFSVNDRLFYLYPVSLGKMYLIQRQIEALEINSAMLKMNPTVEMLRLANQKKDECLRFIAYHACQGKEILSESKVKELTDFFGENMVDSDIATLLSILLIEERTETYMKSLGIDKELEDLNLAMEIKKRFSKNSISFGGKSVYGTLIYPLLELGMTWNEIVWERSYVNIRLLLSDKIESVYFSDEEMKKVPAKLKHRGETKIKATKETIDQIKKMDWR